MRCCLPLGPAAWTRSIATAIRASAVSSRFLMVEETGGTHQTQINVVLNWAEELKRRVPVKR